MSEHFHTDTLITSPEGLLTRFTAICACGWRSHACYPLATAEGQIADHVEDATAPPVERQVVYVIQRLTDGGEWGDVDRFAGRGNAFIAAQRRDPETTRVVRRTTTDEVLYDHAEQGAG